MRDAIKSRRGSMVLLPATSYASFAFQIRITSNSKRSGHVKGIGLKIMNIRNTNPVQRYIEIYVL
jgi:hypothetical protein